MDAEAVLNDARRRTAVAKRRLRPVDEADPVKTIEDDTRFLQTLREVFQRSKRARSCRGLSVINAPSGKVYHWDRQTDKIRRRL